MIVDSVIKSRLHDGGLHQKTFAVHGIQCAQSFLGPFVAADNNFPAVIPDLCISRGHQAPAAPVSPGLAGGVNVREEYLAAAFFLKLASGLNIAVHGLHHLRIYTILIKDFFIIKQDLGTDRIWKCIDFSVNGSILGSSVNHFIQKRRQILCLIL